MRRARALHRPCCLPRPAGCYGQSAVAGPHGGGGPGGHFAGGSGGPHGGGADSRLRVDRPLAVRLRRVPQDNPSIAALLRRDDGGWYPRRLLPHMAAPTTGFSSCPAAPASSSEVHGRTTATHPYHYPYCIRTRTTGIRPRIRLLPGTRASSTRAQHPPDQHTLPTRSAAASRCRRAAASRRAPGGLLRPPIYGYVSSAFGGCHRGPRRTLVDARQLDERWLPVTGQHTITVRLRDGAPLDRRVDVPAGASQVMSLDSFTDDRG
jgi:hypothetical protein